MKKNKKLFILLCTFIMTAFLWAPALAQQKVTITGTVTSGYEIETENGQIYEIGDNEKGDELSEYVDSKVRVTGTVEEIDEEKIITVISFTVIEE